MKLTKLIITIPEDKYKYIQGLEQGNTDYATTRMLYHAVKKGIPLDKIRAEIEQLHCHPKLDFIKNDEVVDMALDVIDKYSGGDE